MRLSLTASGSQLQSLILSLFCLARSAAAAPPLEVTPPMIDFGTVLVAAVSAPQTVTLKNTIIAPVTIKDVQLTGANSNQFKVDDPSTLGLPWDLRPGQSRVLSVTYAPVAGGQHSASLLIVPINSATTEVSLIGNAPPTPGDAGPPSTDHLDFGDVRIGTQSDPKPVHLRNTVMQTLTITEITSSQTDFLLDGPLPKKFVLAPYDTTDFNVVFLPTREGPHQGTIDVLIKGASAPFQTIKVTGYAFHADPAFPPVAQSNCGISPRARAAPSSLWPLLAAMILCARRRKRH